MYTASGDLLLLALRLCQSPSHQEFGFLVTPYCHLPPRIITTDYHLPSSLFTTSAKNQTGVYTLDAGENLENKMVGLMSFTPDSYQFGRLLAIYQLATGRQDQLH